jgi:hypothetical protein
MSDNHGVPLSPADHSDHALRQAGDTMMRRRRWAEAASAFAGVVDRDAATEMKRRLSANLASLERHRPDVYETLVALPAQQQYAVAATASGKPTIVHRTPDGATVSLSSGNDPLAAAAAARQQIYGATKAGEAVGLCGIGDGYLAQVLAHDPPALFMDKQQPVFVIEPEPQIALQCMMIHDYAGAAGPIEQARFYWFVGTGWEKRLEATLLGDLFLASPSIMVGQGSAAPQIQAALRGIVAKLVARDNERAAQIEQNYAGRSAGDFAARFETNRPGRPRVLLLTTRLSTVLQYSTRDTAAAFERLGWETRVVIEPSPHHRVLSTALRAAVAEFEPDLIFQIDHLRHEHNGLFPASVPFACWIQDHLPHLATRMAGASVGPLDFVLTDAAATYAEKFGYPLGQCIALPKLAVDCLPLPSAGEGRGEGEARSVHRRHSAAELPMVPPHPNPLPQGEREQEADDLVFVSNASQSPDAMVEQAVATYGQSPTSRELVTRCCRRMIDTYASGSALPTYNDVCATLHATLAELGLKLPTEDFDRLARWLTHPFNDALYRQQALGWAADAAQDIGLTLALYGKGWEHHPRFAPFARGPIAYGKPLAQLTRRSRINLQIVPYLCLHQRLLDGLMAGGFFLVRTHPADLAPGALLDFLIQHTHDSARTTPAAATSLPPSLRFTFDALVNACRPCLSTTGGEDLVTMVRDWQEAGQLVPREGPLPLLDHTGFHDAATLRERLGRFVHAPALRNAVSATQRQSVAERLTYDAGIKRVVARMRELLSGTNQGDVARTEPRLIAA